MRYPTGLPGNAPFRAVAIESVEDNQILARDQHGASMALPRIIRVREPIVGETWLVDRTFGAWTLAAVVDSLLIPHDPLEHIPSGAMMDYAGSSAPEGWLLTDGGLHLIDDYPDLFDVIGTTYGGDGLTNFRVPDRRGRVSVGEGTLGSDTYSLGDTGGEARHQLSISEMPSHNHGGTNNDTHAHGSGSYSTNNVYDVVSDVQVGGAAERARKTGRNEDFPVSGASSDSTHSHGISSQGGNAAHENRQPYLVVTHIIKT